LFYFLVKRVFNFLILVVNVLCFRATRYYIVHRLRYGWRSLGPTN